MICNQCNIYLPDDLAFCTNCGVAIVDEPETVLRPPKVELRSPIMGIKGKWFYEKFLPEDGSYRKWVNARIFRGKILDDLGNGVYQVEVHVSDNRLVNRVINISEMESWEFVSDYNQLIEGITKWEGIIRMGAELEESLAEIESTLDELESEVYNRD